MDRRIIILAAMLLGVICVPEASAQTVAAKVAIISGNGQVSCINCVPPRPNLPTGAQLQPLVVKVTDASGKPIANHEVDWIANSAGALLGNIRSPATFTDATGTATNYFDQNAVQAAALGFGFVQATITATSDSATATFYETQSLSDPSNRIRFFVEGQPINPPTSTITGVAGGTSSTNLVVHIDDSLGNAVPNVSVRVLQEPLEQPSTNAGSVSCATGPGADPGSILTDSTGTGTCTLVFGANPGTGTLHVTVGGTASNFYDPTTFPPVFLEFPGIAFSTAASTPGGITISSGNSQSSAPGLILASPLVAKVTDATGAIAIAGQAVTWTVSPAGAATVNPTSSTSDAQGMVSTNVTLSTSASGQVTVTAALTANSAIKAAFTVNTIITVTVTGLQKVSGDIQTAIVGAGFSQPLVVQVNTSSGVAANFPVTFSVSGPGTIGGKTTTTVNTDSTGKAQATVTAGSTTGAVTVTATAGAFSQSFTLTAIPVGPNLTVNSFFNTAGLKQGSMSPCSLVTISASGLAPGVQGTLSPLSLFGQLPLTLGPDKVAFNNVQAPILQVSNSGGQEQVIAQVPCEVTPGSSVPVTVNVGGGSATVNVAIQAASPGIFETVMSDGTRRAVMTRPDGSFVSLENPARRGEVIRVYVTGLGPTAPAVGTNSIPIPGTDSMVLGQVIVGVNNSGARVVSARLAPTQIGIYEVAFQVDSNAPTGNNIVLSVALNPTDGSATQFSNGSKIPIQ